MLGISISGPRYEIVEKDVIFYTSFTLPPGSSPADVEVTWYKDNEIVPQLPSEDQFSLILYDVDFPAAGTFYAIIKNPATGETSRSNSITLEIGLKPRDITLDINSRTIIYSGIGEIVALRPRCTITPPYATKVCRWYRNDVQISPDEDVDITIEDSSYFGTYVLKSTGTCEGAFVPTENNLNVEIRPRETGPGRTCPLIYDNDLNPSLPYGGGRNESYIWIGWWVWDEIRYAVTYGIDWTTDIENSNFKYKCELQKVASLLAKYPDVDVQESRNGYILHRKDLLP